MAGSSTPTARIRLLPAPGRPFDFLGIPSGSGPPLQTVGAKGYDGFAIALVA
jgi:hypothetical protein